MTPKRPALWATTLYYAQGLPYSIVRAVAQVYFIDLGVPTEKLGLVALYGNAWTWKPLWSPLVDRFSTKRRWVLAMEVLMAVFAGVLGFTAMNGSGLWTAIVIFGILAMLSATHDIATDGLYLEALNKDDQARYSGWIVAFYRLALMTGSGLLIKESKNLGWPAIFGMSAAIFAVIVVWHFFVLPDPRKPKSDATGYKKLLEGFQTFFQLPGIWLAIPFFLFFKLGDALLFGMSTPFLLKYMNMSRDDFGMINGYLGVLSAVGASIFGGWFISKFKLRRGLWVFGIVQNLAIPVYAVLARVQHPALWMFAVGIVTEQIAAALGTAAYSNFLMRQTDPRYRATHYAIASGMMSLTTMLGGAISGYGVAHFGYEGFFIMAFFASIPGFLLVPWIARRPECQ